LILDSLFFILDSLFLILYSLFFISSLSCKFRIKASQLNSNFFNNSFKFQTISNFLITYLFEFFCYVSEDAFNKYLRNKIKLIIEFDPIFHANQIKRLFILLFFRAVIFCSQHRTRSIHLMSFICWIIPAIFFGVYFVSIPCQGIVND
jgi:hypothetical protein